MAWHGKPNAHVGIKQWNATAEVWEELPTTYDSANGWLRTSLNTAQATLGIFQIPATPKISGQASWYDWHGAAMNAFPIGTDVIVTNPKTGKKTTTRVVSTGPFTPGRIIDLPREVFAKIGNLWDGVMDVTVKPILIAGEKR